MKTQVEIDQEFSRITGQEQMDVPTCFAHRDSAAVAVGYHANCELPLCITCMEVYQSIVDLSRLILTKDRDLVQIVRTRLATGDEKSICPMCHYNLLDHLETVRLAPLEVSK